MGLFDTTDVQSMGNTEPIILLLFVPSFLIINDSLIMKQCFF